MTYFLRLLMCVLCVTGTAIAKPPLLMPMPVSVTNLDGQLQLTSSHLSVYLDEKYRSSSKLLFENAAFLKNFSSVTWQDKHSAQLKLEVAVWLDDIPRLDIDESYQLIISTKAITLKSQTQFGMLRGFATLNQLLFSAKTPYQLNAMTINDAPTYPWRGLLFDGVRHFLPISDVKRTLRGLASAKMNVFHWHLTDDQGWRVALKSYPKLHQVASDGFFYTAEEIKDVVAYAASLGIRVVPEFDVPGHASSIVLAYPELGSGTKLDGIERRWGVFRPLLDPSNPDVYLFVEDVVKELTALFPDHYLHIGGDEIDDRDWRENTQIQLFMAKHKLSDTHVLHAYFNQRVANILAKYNRKMIGWDEVLHPNLPKQTLVQSWRGHHSLAAIQEAGFDGLLSSGFYIDQPQWTSYHYRNHPEPVKSKTLSAKEVINHSAFTLTRLKGSSVNGKVTVFRDTQSLLAALVSIEGKGRFITDQVLQTEHGFELLIDTWMGPTKLFVGKTKSDRPAFVGNTPYEMKSKSENKPSLRALNNALHDEQGKDKSGRGLGGEATLWAELLTTESLDTRLWPRLYAIAERFWSPKTQVDERDMYRRLVVMDRFASLHGGKHKQQLNERLKTLLDDNVTQDEIAKLLKFSEFLEPAHYYTLHHLAYLRDEYHHGAPLDKLVDVLPVESLMLREFDYSVDDYMQTCSKSLETSLQLQIDEWREFIKHNKRLIERITEWQNPYLQIKHALQSKESQLIINNNGTIAHLVASLNHYQKVSSLCKNSG